MAFPGQGPSEKIAQFYSVLLSFGLVRTAEWIERRIEQKTAVKKSWFGWVRLSPFGSRWVRNGSEDGEAIWHPGFKRTSVGGGFSRDVVTRVILSRVYADFLVVTES